MVAVLLALGGFVYVRTERDLLAAVDAGLRSRAQALAEAVGGPAEHDQVVATGALVDSDESFAQVLGADGALLDATPIVRSGAAPRSGRGRGTR